MGPEFPEAPFPGAGPDYAHTAVPVRIRILLDRASLAEVSGDEVALPRQRHSAHVLRFGALTESQWA